MHHLKIFGLLTAVTLLAAPGFLQAVAQEQVSSQVTFSLALMRQNGKIAFTSTRDGNVEIYVMDADGSKQTRLTNNTFLDRTPAWSPDGGQIAFASNRTTGNFDIFVMNADGSAQTNISNGVQADFQDPDWSPDGTKIACSQANVQGVRAAYGVLVMRADGSNQTRLSTVDN